MVIGVIRAIRVLRVNYYQYAFNYQKEKEKLCILAEMCQNLKKWLACGYRYNSTLTLLQLLSELTMTWW